MSNRIKLTKGRVALSLFALLVGCYFLGPAPDPPELVPALPEAPQGAEALEAYVRDKEAAAKGLKPDNEARIVWADDSARAVTEWAVVYVHGFSSSQGEGDPVHRQFAERYGCNLYLSRLQAHGTDGPDNLLGFSGEGYVNSVKEAAAIGRRLGEKVLLMTCSTGGTAGLWLAAENPEAVDALLLYSPNIAIADPSAFLLDKPWGQQIAEAILGGRYVDKLDNPENTPEILQYWQRKYRIEAAVELQALVSETMHEGTFSKVEQPVFLAYYYKNEEEQDPVVSVSAMLEMYDQLGTPEGRKRKQAFPEAGDHVIGSRHRTESYAEVLEATCRFAEETLGMQPVAR